MDTNLTFEITEVDEISSVPSDHLSFIIRQLLPVRLIGRFRCEDYIKNLMKGDSIKECLEDGVNIIPTGSLAEGFNMPPVCLRKSKDDVRFEDNTDIDFMRVEVETPVTFQSEKMDACQYKVLIYTEGMHPGYVKLNLSTDASSPNYLHTEKLQRQQQAMHLDQSKPDKLEINGPAITTLYNIKKDSVETKSYIFKRDKVLSQDSVLALPCSEWPPMATGWIQRQQNGKWIDDNMIDSLVNDGCHVVPAAHRLSVASDVEWRISFAVTETRVAREIVTDVQRQAYVFIKLLYYHVLKQKEVLTSYHMKTMFLYACEQLPASAWAKNLGACVFYILDLTIECVKKKKIPHFFIPENNLIDYLTDVEIESIIKSLEDLRSDPITPVMDFTDHRLVGYAAFEITFRNLMEPVLEDMKEYAKHKDIRRTVLEAFVPVIFKNLTSHINQRSYKEAVYIAEDLHSLLLKYNHTDEDFGAFCFRNVANGLTDTSKSSLFLEKAIQMHDGDSSFEECKENLPCLYHAASYRYPRGSNENKEFISKADHAFKSRFEREHETGVHVDYALFLIKQSRLDEAIALLQKVIKRNDTTTANVYDANELMTLDEVLQTEIYEHYKFSAPSVSLAYYLLIDCLFEINKAPNTHTYDILREFKIHADEINLPRVFALYGYSCMLLKEWSSGSEAFQTAFRINVGAEYTRAAKMKKYCDEMVNEMNSQ